MGRLPRAVWLSTLLALGSPLALPACSAGPVASWQGARLFGSGSRALEAGEVERAIADLEGAAARVPHASEIRNHLGIAYARAGRHPEALAAFEQAVALDCDNAAAVQNLSDARNLAEARAREARGASPDATR